MDQQQLYSPGFWDVIKRIVNLLSHRDTRSLNQTCQLLRKHVPHKCVPPSTEEISGCDCDLEKLQTGKLELSEGLILKEVPLDFELPNLIQCYCPKLKYLFIKYSCKCDVTMLNFENLPCVGIYIKINLLNMNCPLSIDSLPSTVENLTVHISRIDPETFKTIPGEYKGTISLIISHLVNLKSL
jgi:hypothetical protein